MDKSLPGESKPWKNLVNLTPALLAVTAAIPVSLQPHSVKFYSFLVVAARPQPCRGGWRGESPVLRKLKAKEAKWGTAARCDVPGSWRAARSLCRLLRAEMSCVQVSVHHSCHSVPGRIGASSARLPVAGRCRPPHSAGRVLRERAETLALQPLLV